MVVAISGTEWIPTSIIATYQLQALFRAYMHHVSIYVCRDPEKTWALGGFQMNEVEVETILDEWKLEWK